MAWVGAIKTVDLESEDRFSHRHRLALGAQALTNGNAARVDIYNLSSSGLLIASDLPFEVGEEIEVELPEAGTTRARVVWRSDEFHGCEFISPVSAAAVSAARLRSPAPQLAAAPTVADTADDLPATLVDSDELAPGVKVAIIVGLALACWAVLGLAALPFI
jgi:hypothetical protein